MSDNLLNEREFELINIIGQELGSSQRDLSRQMNLSLGQTNMLIRRLISKGCIRVRQLNKKKMMYILTPQGLAEKMEKSVNYTLKTIHSIGKVRNQIVQMLQILHAEGLRHFHVFGQNDLVALIEMSLMVSGLELVTCTKHESVPSEQVDGVLLVCFERWDSAVYPADNYINVIEELAKSGRFNGSALV